MIKTSKISLISILLAAGFLVLPQTAVLAQTNTQALNVNASTANTLCKLNFFSKCSTDSGTAKTQKKSGGLFAELFAAILGGSSDAQSTATAVITLVRVPGKTEIYQIIGGKKHVVSTVEIFESYGFTTDMIQDITAKQLAKYPRAKLLTVVGDKNGAVFYLTEAGTIRQVLNEKVMASYGDTRNDIITINQKEFNFYPRNEFVFVEAPALSRDVFQLVEGTKRYVTPMALRRLKLDTINISPINVSELDEYLPAQPIIF